MKNILLIILLLLSFSSQAQHLFNQKNRFTIQTGIDPATMLTLRYENLVEEPSLAMAKVYEHLNLPAGNVSIYQGEIRDQTGDRWTANSSFQLYDGVSNLSVVYVI